MASKLKFFKNDGVNELSRLLTTERLRKTGLADLSKSASHDPDVEAFRQVVRSSSNKTPAKGLGVTRHILKKLGA